MSHKYNIRKKRRFFQHFQKRIGGLICHLLDLCDYENSFFPSHGLQISYFPKSSHLFNFYRVSLRLNHHEVRKITRIDASTGCARLTGIIFFSLAVHGFCQHKSHLFFPHSLRPTEQHGVWNLLFLQSFPQDFFDSLMSEDIFERHWFVLSILMLSAQCSRWTDLDSTFNAHLTL